MFELIEIDTFNAMEKVVAKSFELEKLRNYAVEKYSNNNDPEFDKEIHTGKDSMLYKYENRGGQYQGSGYKPHAYIRVVKEDKVLIIK